LVEDPKRWFRYIDLCSKTNKAINPDDIEVLRSTNIALFSKMPFGKYLAALKKLFLGPYAMHNLQLMVNHNLVANMFTADIINQCFYPKPRFAYFLSKIEMIKHSPSFCPEISILAVFLSSEVYSRRAEEKDKSLIEIINDVIKRFESEIGETNAGSSEFKANKWILQSNLMFNYFDLVRFNTERRTQRNPTRGQAASRPPASRNAPTSAQPSSSNDAQSAPITSQFDYYTLLGRGTQGGEVSSPSCSSSSAKTTSLRM